MEEKYIKLLLERCLKVSECDCLFINYNKINKEFVDKVVEYANNMGIEDIYLNENDSYYIHDLLKNLSKEEVMEHEAFNSKIWDEYASKGGAFLLLESEIPNLMDDIDSDVLAASSYKKTKTKPIYKEKQLNGEIPWCIAAVPNKLWAEDIFKDSDNPLNDFWSILAKICMLDKDDPAREWDKFLKMQEEKTNKLNKLEIKKLHLKNSLGTDLTIELNEKALWQTSSSNKWIVNMPSYEVFTTPDYRLTNGTVYSSMPLIYNGKVIDEFNITFKDGKVKEFKAKKGEDILKEIIEGDKYSAFLGEVAIVDYDSPISNTKKIFKSTLFDENASCHLALGSGFTECIKGGFDMSKEELEELGMNSSKNHVDFMIGTKDLTIEVECMDGKVTIMEEGNLII